MNLEFMNEYLVLVVLGICLCVGYLIKTSIKQIQNDCIPLIVAILGVLLNIWINNSITPDVVFGGLASGLASTGLHEAYSKMIKKK